ncbi:hypothetical protein L7F22_010777 [Adiantum nelumboides]|nr:hypothetical protein [Adiantum nelumboides]
MREVQTIAYSKFLESYKSVTMEAMAKAFGVNVNFIDMELSRFIAAGRLHCKIDNVAGVLETNCPDAKNALYQAIIKQGDFHLNGIQNLSRVKENQGVCQYAQMQQCIILHSQCHFLVENAKFMLDGEEHFQELMTERLRLFGERSKEQGFWLVIEPQFLEKFLDITKQLKRPAVDLVSTN